MILLYAVAERLQIPLGQVLDMTEAEIAGWIVWAELAKDFKQARGNRWPLKRNIG